MLGKRLSCTVSSEVYQEIIQFIERGLWPSRAAFLREAIECNLQRQRIRDRLLREGMLGDQAQVHPANQEELLLALRRLKEQVIELRNKIGFEMRVAVLLSELDILRERTQTYVCIAETSDIPPETVQILRGLVDENSLDEPPFYKAKLALDTLWEYLKSPLANLPKTDVETWREVSRTAEWKQTAHTELTKIASNIDRVLQKLNTYLVCREPAASE